MKILEKIGVNLAELLKVKSLITLTIVGAITYGFIQKTVPVELYAAYTASIITYYFNKEKTEK